MSPSTTASQQNLRTLCYIRMITLGSLLVAAGYLYQLGSVFLPWLTLLPLVLVFALIIAFSLWRSYQPFAVHPYEMLAHLLIDVGLIFLLLFFSGGANNPFVSYYLVPVTIAAITLTRPLSGSITVLCLLAYTVLLFRHLPVPALSPASEHHAHTGSNLNLHVLGMWINFTVSALLIAYFITRMATTIRQQDDALGRQREQTLEDEQLLAVATVAASTAHELGTPLNTISLIIEDLNTQSGVDKEDIATLKQQVERCQETLAGLAQTARSFSVENAGPSSTQRYFQTLIDNWLVIRPDVNLSLDNQITIDSPQCYFHPSLAASLYNLLNNAGDASPDRVDISLRTTANDAIMTIRDYGEGLGKIVETPGKAPVLSNKSSGMGLGLFLSRSILNRHGCTVQFADHPDGGTLITVSIPLQKDSSKGSGYA